MKYSNEDGTLDAFLLPFVVTLILLVVSIIFGAATWHSETKYKSQSDQLVTAAVAKSVTQTQAADAINYANEAKQPLKTFNGPQTFGSVVVMYPKTWSAYVSENDNNGVPLNGYFQPDVVPSVSDQTSVFALRLEVLPEPYDQALTQYTSSAQQKQVTVTPFSFPKVSSIVGVRVDGAIQPQKQGSMVIMPLRNQTIELWTESQNYISDFNSNILPNFSFSP